MRKLSPRALDVLENGLTVVGKTVKIAGQIDRRLYVEVNAALESLGGRWNRSAKAHLFDESPEDAIDQVLVDGGWHDRKRDLDQFFTPPELAKLVVERADVKGKTVLEPTAGEGALAHECLRQGAEHVWSVEVDAKLCHELRKPVGVRGLHDVHCGDFLMLHFLTLHRGATPTVDRVVMNPPFGNQRDVLFVEAALAWVKPGGRLVAIMGGGVVFRTNLKTNAFRELVEQHGGTIDVLPPGSFKSSGTDVNACIVTMRR